MLDLNGKKYIIILIQTEHDQNMICQINSSSFMFPAVNNDNVWVNWRKHWVHYCTSLHNQSDKADTKHCFDHPYYVTFHTKTHRRQQKAALWSIVEWEKETVTGDIVRHTLYSETHTWIQAGRQDLVDTIYTYRRSSVQQTHKVCLFFSQWDWRHVCLISNWTLLSMPIALPIHCTNAVSMWPAEHLA